MEKSEAEEEEERAFLNDAQGIARTLGDIADPFAPRAQLRAVVGLKTDGSTPLTQPEIFDEDDEEEEEDDEEEEEEEM